MVSFELVDNLLQIIVLTGMMVISAILAWKKRERRYIILMFFYACFAMGTLYYVFYLLILGKIPQVFYVAEVSWLAAYLFLLSLQIVRIERKKVRFSWKAMAATVIDVIAIFVIQILGPSYFMTSAYAITAGILVYLAVYQLQQGRKSGIDRCLLTSIQLQILLYLVSCFIRDYTHFNLYFAVDFMLTGSFVMLFPLVRREVEKNDIY